MKKIGFIALALVIIGVICQGTQTEFNVTGTDTYLVSGGDTLWSIAAENTPEDEDIRDYMTLMKKYNEGLTADIKVGQMIYLPIVEVE